MSGTERTEALVVELWSVANEDEMRVEHERVAEAWAFLDTAHVFECTEPDER